MLDPVDDLTFTHECEFVTGPGAGGQCGDRPLSSDGFKWRGNSRFPRVAWWCLLLRTTNPGRTSCQLGEFSFILPIM